jgi:hypothetical protein
MQYAYAYQLNGTQAGGLDPDANAYILAVEAADGQALEAGVKKAYNTFVKGCKSDGTWNAIKASCIMAGARTLSGALVPLKGTAPTNFNFVSGDYNRETGLLGNGTTKYLVSNRNNNADPQNNKHLAIYLNELPTGISAPYIGSGVQSGGSQLARVLSGTFTTRINSGSGSNVALESVGFIGTSRSSSTIINSRVGGITSSVSNASATPATEDIRVFSRLSPLDYSTQRASFYSIGEAVDLAKLDSRVITLMSNIATAIP